jgi:hypothetical protein
MEVNEMIELLKQGSIRVITDNQTAYFVTHTCNNTNTYFWNNGRYIAYGNYEGANGYDQLQTVLSRVIRIEKHIDTDYYPIWTKEDGVITQSDKFVKLKGRYYTTAFLEQLIDKIIEFKKINI